MNDEAKKVRAEKVASCANGVGTRNSFLLSNHHKQRWPHPNLFPVHLYARFEISYSRFLAPSLHLSIIYLYECEEIFLCIPLAASSFLIHSDIKYDYPARLSART